MTDRTVTLNVRRGEADGESRIESFEVPYAENMSVLDALIWIRAHRDASLAIRYSCINANACKECMVRVDGKVAYACTARLGTREAMVEPLSNKPLLRDLVTDITPPKETLANALAGED